MDFVPVYDEVTFTVGSTQDNSVCTEIHMVPDEFVESREVFEVQLLPNHNDPLGAIVQSDRMRALVAISDVETERRMFGILFTASNSMHVHCKINVLLQNLAYRCTDLK